MNETTTPTPPTPIPVRIVRLVAHNVQKLKAIEIKPAARSVTLTGRNAHGKSSILLSIAMVLAGKRAMPERPIREGQSKADTTIEFGQFIADLRLTAAGAPKITVRSTEGIPIPSPATFLKESSNEILLDPVGFMRLGETPEGRRRQGALLQGLVGLDFSDLDADKAQSYAQREAVNREMATTRGKLTSFPFDDQAPAEEVLVSKLMQELRAGQQTNKENEKVKTDWLEGTALISKGEAIAASTSAELEAARIWCRLPIAPSVMPPPVLSSFHDALHRSMAHAFDALETYTHAIGECVRCMNEAEQNQTEHAGVLTAIKSTIPDLETKVAALRYADLEAIQRRIEEADGVNQRVRANRRHNEIKHEIGLLQAKSESLSEHLTKIEQTKREQLAAAKYPLPGLSFDESGILLNGLPLAQGSQAQQLKAVLAIGFALKPRIRVALIKDASILDDASLKDVDALLEQYEAQAWLECVRSDDPAAIEIEDGEVVS